MRLAPALVGPPDPDLDVPRRPPDLRLAAAGGVRGVRLAASSSATPTSSTRGSRRRSGRSRRSAGPSRRPSSAATTRATSTSTAREIIRLWENRMIFSGLFLLGEIPFTDVIIHSTVLAADGRRMSKSLGTGIDPLEAVDAARRRRDALRPAQDLLDPGRPLLLGRDRGGPQAREQALERRAADPPERRGRRRRRCEPTRARGALDPRADRRDARAGRGGAGRAFDFAAAANALYHLTFDDFCDWYAEAIKPRLYDDDEDAAARPRSPRSSACSRSCTRWCRT